MIKKVINRLEAELRTWLETIPLAGRMKIVLVLFLLFASGSIYMTVSSIYHLGTTSRKTQMQIEHIRGAESQYRLEADSENN